MKQRGKHIVIVTHYYPPHIGGIEIVAYNQAKYLAKAGYTVTIVTSTIGGVTNGYSLPGVRIIRVPALNLFEQFSIPFPIFSPSLIPVLRRVIQTADIVHVHDAFYLSSYVAARVARRYHKPLVVTQHVEIIRHPLALVVAIQKLVYRTTGNFIFQTSRKIISYNARVQNFLLSRGIPKEKLLTIQNGVDTQLFYPVSAKQKKLLKKQFGLPLDKKIILFVGRYVPKKGFDKVIAARGPEYCIVCTGGETPAEPIDGVMFLGKLKQQKLAEVYKAVDIFLLPSDSEGFPLSIQEAMASGLPIVTTNDKGYKEYSLDPNNMVLLDKPTGVSIRNVLLDLVADEAKLKQMGEYTHRYAVEHFSWPVAIQYVENLYTTLLVEDDQPLSVPPGRNVCVTTSWDDGHVLDLRLAVLLEKYGIKGTFYISPHNTEQVSVDRLTPEQTRLLSRYCEIGAHTMHHYRLPELSDTEAQSEIVGSKTYLEQCIEKPVTSFCYPCGDYRERHVQMVRDAGFQYARTITRHTYRVGNPLESTTTVHAYNHLLDIGTILRVARFNPIRFFRYLTNWDELAIASFDTVLSRGGVFHLWGHSWEIDQHGDWEKLERVLAHIAHRNGVEYLTNGQLALREKEQPLSVLMATPYFVPHIGGTQLYVYNVAARLVTAGLRVVVATTGGRGFFKMRKEAFDGLTIYRLPYWLKLSNTPINPLWYFHFKKIVRSERIAIVNAHTPVPFFADLAARASGGLPVVVTYHGGSLKKGNPYIDWMIWIYEHLLLKPLLGRADKIVCTSDFVRNGFLYRYQKKSLTITPGVDIDLFAPQAQKPLSKKKRILFVASLTAAEQYKGLATLISAARILKEAGVDFEVVVVGEGAMRATYERQVAARQLSQHVVFKGRVTGKALAELYRDVDVLAHPTSVEAFGMVVLEAMASGLPVVASNVGGLPLLIKDGENGYLISPRDPAALAKKILTLLQDSSLRESFGKQGRIRAVAQYRWDDRAIEYRALYRSLVEPAAYALAAPTPISHIKKQDIYAFKVSVVLLTYNAIDTIKDVLKAIFDQEFETFEVICIDTSSTDGTREVLQRYPIRLVSIDPQEFGHGKTRNEGARLAKGEFVVFITQDAVPAHRHWLRDLIQEFSDPTVAGVYGRQIPRRDENTLDKYFQMSLYGTRRVVRDKKNYREGDNVFSDANSAVRKDLILTYPYMDSIIMSEDYEWADRMIKMGYTIVYSPSAAVVHSHSYTLRKLFKRNFDSGVSFSVIYKTNKSKTFFIKGMRVTLREIRNLYNSGNALLIPAALFRDAIRYIAIQMGKREHLFSKKFKRTYLSAQTWYWK